MKTFFPEALKPDHSPVFQSNNLLYKKYQAVVTLQQLTNQYSSSVQIGPAFFFFHSSYFISLHMAAVRYQNYQHPSYFGRTQPCLRFILVLCSGITPAWLRAIQGAEELALVGPLQGKRSTCCNIAVAHKQPSNCTHYLQLCSYAVFFPIFFWASRLFLLK